MSLDYDMSKVRDFEALHADDEEATITQALVFHCMAIGMNGFTEDNWTEAYARIALVEKVNGPSISGPIYKEFDPRVLAPPEGTKYVRVNGTLYFYEGFDLTGKYVDRDEGYYSLLLSKYEHNGFSASKGESVVYVLDDSEDTFEYMSGFEPKPIKPEDVHRRIGMTTNVANETRAKWTKRTMEYWLNERVRTAKRVTATN